MVRRVAILVLVLGSLAVAQSAPSKDPAAALRRKLFKERFLDHFNLGVEAPAEWIMETRERNGCRWDCSVQYLSGGAATGEKPFWLNFGNSPQKLVADAKKAGIVPWYSFYLLAASAPARYRPDPPHATLANVKVPGTMKEYFGLFKTCMEGFGKEAPWPVMVHIEPDEWCHLLLNSGMDPAKVDVKVGSCGMEELKGLPDNLFGFASAFKRLRDLYAPANVLLGCNPSAFDPGSMTGVKMGQIMKAVAGDWDFAVFETSDRDKGMKGKAPPYSTDIDVTGSLDAHVKWIADFHAVSGLYVFVWQVAAGNTVYATCNNTPGHYCDNLMQLLLEDYPQNPTIAHYVKSGCVGWMNVGGQGEGSTHVYDAKKDGITNPPAIPGNQGKKSEYADDDGGFMRLRGAAYYKKPFPIPGKAGAPAKPADPKPPSTPSTPDRR